MYETSEVREGTLKEVIRELHQHRLEADLTYQELANRIGVSFFPIFRLLKDRDATCSERTEYKIRKYLATLQRKREAAGAR